MENYEERTRKRSMPHDVDRDRRGAKFHRISKDDSASSNYTDATEKRPSSKTSKAATSTSTGERQPKPQRREKSASSNSSNGARKDKEPDIEILDSDDDDDDKDDDDEGDEEEGDDVEEEETDKKTRSPKVVNTMRVLEVRSNPADKNSKLLEVAIYPPSGKGTREVLTVLERRPPFGFLLPSYCPFMRYRNVTVNRQPEGSQIPTIEDYEGAYCIDYTRSMVFRRIRRFMRHENREALKEEQKRTHAIRYRNVRSVSEILDELSRLEHKSAVAKMLKNAHLCKDALWLSRFFKCWSLLKLSEEECAQLRAEFESNPISFWCFSVFRNHPNTSPWKRQLSCVSAEALVRAQVVLRKMEADRKRKEGIGQKSADVSEWKPVEVDRNDAEIVARCQERFTRFGNTAFRLSDTAKAGELFSEAQKYARSVLVRIGALKIFSVTSTFPRTRKSLFATLQCDYGVAREFVKHFDHWTSDRLLKAPTTEQDGREGSPIDLTDECETSSSVSSSSESAATATMTSRHPKTRLAAVKTLQELARTRRLVLVAYRGDNIRSFLRDLAVRNGELRPSNTLMLTPDEGSFGKGCQKIFDGATVGTLRDWMDALDEHQNSVNKRTVAEDSDENVGAEEKDRTKDRHGGKKEGAPRGNEDATTAQERPSEWAHFRFAMLMEAHRVPEYALLDFLNRSREIFESIVLFGDMYQSWQSPEDGGGCPFSDLSRVHSVVCMDLLDSVVSTDSEEHILSHFRTRLRAAIKATRAPYLEYTAPKSENEKVDYAKLFRDKQEQAASIASKHIDGILDAATIKVTTRSTAKRADKSVKKTSSRSNEDRDRSESKQMIKCVDGGLAATILLKAWINDHKQFAVFCNHSPTSVALRKELFDAFYLGDRVFVDRHDTCVYRISGFYTTNHHSCEEHAKKSGLRFVPYTRPHDVRITNEIDEFNVPHRIYAAVVPVYEGRLRKFADPNDPEEKRVLVTGNPHFRKASLFDETTVHQMSPISAGMFFFSTDRVDPYQLYTFALNVKNVLVLAPLRLNSTVQLVDASSCLKAILSRHPSFRETLINQLVPKGVVVPKTSSVASSSSQSSQTSQ